MARSTLVLILAGIIAWVTFSTARALAATYPTGLAARDIVSGIAPGRDPGSCCWIVGQGTFRTRVPADADTLVITVFQPAYSLTGQSPRTFEVTLDGVRATRCCYGPGLWKLAFNVPPAARGRDAIVTIVPSSTFVPRTVGIGNDTRHLSALLASVRFIDITAGDNLDAPPVQANAAYRIAAAIALALGFIAPIVAMRRRPALAVVALVITDPFALFLYEHGTSMTLPKSVLLGTIAGLLLVVRRLPRPGRAFTILAIAQSLLVGSMLISSLHAENLGLALREVFKAIQYLLTFAVAYAGFRIDPDETLVRRAIVAVTAIVSVLALGQLFVGANEYGSIAGHPVPRIAGALEGPNQLSGFLDIMLPLILGWTLYAPRRAAALVALALGAVALAFTFSRGGQGALVVAVAFMLALRFAPERAATIAAAIGVVFASLLGVAFAQFTGIIRWTGLFGNTIDTSGLGTRSDLWNGAYTLWRSSPFSGIGPGNFELLISRYYPGVRTHANSVYFNTLAEQGLVGILALGCVIAAMIWAFARRFREPLILGTLGVICATCFHQIVDTMWFYPKIGIIFWTVLGVAAAYSDRAPMQQESVSS